MSNLKCPVIGCGWSGLTFMEFALHALAFHRRHDA